MMRRPGAKLGEYLRKRPPEATVEPFGEEPAGPGRTLRGAFVVQLHDATRRHYDVRLELAGVLASFAVPRGPSLDPGDKSLAIRTEDHPLEYLEFEDVIPEAQYGAGPMIVWDRGMVEYLDGPAEEQIARGKLHVRLRGLKLRGAFTFVKLAKGKTGNEWLMLKKADEHASAERRLTEEMPHSVLSGLTVEELARAGEIAAEHEARAMSLGATRIVDAAAIAAITAPDRSPLVSSVDTNAEEVGPGRVYDAELDGVRVLASREGDLVRLLTWRADGSRDAVDAFYPEVVRALRALPATHLAIDGELVAFDESGHASLALLAKRAERVVKGDVHGAVTRAPVVLVAKDLLLLGDADLRAAPLSARRELLARVAPALGFVRAAPPLEGPLEPIVAFCASHGIAGVVAKDKRSVYDPKRVRWSFVSSGLPRATRQATVDHGAGDAERALRKVEITNRSKVFWPDEGYTKGDLCDYYGAISEAILPYLRDRPVILVRYPDGITGKSFYQWNVPPGMPAWVRTTTIEDPHAEAKRGFLVDDPSTLLYIANLGCIPLHILAFRVPRPEHADFFTIDFDVKQSELRHAVTLARALRGTLDDIGLPGFPKTSGQSGLHVLVALGPGQTFLTARALADLLGALLVQRHPEIATMERVVQKRGTKVYVDTGQTGPSRAIVAPYSVRAVPGATVSAPLAWDEVRPELDPRAFTIGTIPRRVAERGDLLAPMLAARPDVRGAVARLSALVRPA